MSAEFRIHSTLLNDCHRLGRLQHCHVLLHRDAALHWFILVPETDCTDLLDLPNAARSMCINECAVVSSFLKNNLGYPKVNFASIGNVVPQLHLHIIGRTPSDAVWPAPVWGRLATDHRFDQEQLARLCSELTAAIGLRSVADS